MSASGSEDYADGSVHTLTQGGGELNLILGAAARRNQVVLVDFSASWCGPCKMMLPVLQQLAAEFRGRLAVVKVDCEQTAANQDLAQSSSISAFPTFHLYRAQQKVGEMRGANPGGLRNAIQQQLAAAGASGGSAGGSSSGMVNALAAALARVKAGCSYEEFVAAAKTLLTFVGNAIDHPGEEKYRRIRTSNATYQTRLGCRPGGKDAMAAIGFREMMEAGEAVMLLSDVPQELPRVRQLLQQALVQAEAAGAGSAAAVVGPAPAAPAPAVAAAASGSAAQAPAAGSVDAAALARALATALSSGGSGAGGSGAAARPVAGAPAAGVSGARPAGAPKVLRVTPKMLAVVLGKILTEAGIGTQQAPPPPPPGSEGQQG